MLNSTTGWFLHTLNERDYLAEGHAQSLSELCLAEGKKLGLSASRLDNLALLARVHDLGKMGDHAPAPGNGL